MKKVLAGFIMNGYAGGVDKYMMQLARTTHKQIQYDFLTNQYHEELEEELKELGIRLYEVASLKRFYQQYRDVCAILEKERYDAVYLNTSTAISLPLIMAGYVKKVPLRIVHSHSNGIDTANRLKGYVLKAVHTVGRFFIKRMSNRYLACSNSAAKWMFGAKCARDHEYTFVANGVSFSKYYSNEETAHKMRKEYGLENRLVLGHISNFQPVKNSSFLIHVFYEVCKVRTDAALVLIGQGPDLQMVLSRAKELGIEKNVISLGYQNDVSGYYQMLDWFLLPSFFEGLSLVGVEAQVAGDFAIFSDTISEEGVISERAVRLPIDDPKIWADYILKNPIKKEDDNYLLDCADAFDLDHLEDQYVSLFDE